jgi:hypothetical protein
VHNRLECIAALNAGPEQGSAVENAKSAEAKPQSEKHAEAESAARDKTMQPDEALVALGDQLVAAGTEDADTTSDEDTWETLCHHGLAFEGQHWAPKRQGSDSDPPGGDRQKPARAGQSSSPTASAASPILATLRASLLIRPRTSAPRRFDCLSYRSCVCY